MNIKQMLLTPNAYSRPGTKLYSVFGLVWHWVANPMTSPEHNRNFFESRKNGKDGYGSAHYIIGIDGSIVQCIPDDEMAYHVGALQYKESAIQKFGPYPNIVTIGIELCHKTWEGDFTQETLTSLIELSIDLCKKYVLVPSEDIWRHYDITGKDCPKYFVNNFAEYKEVKNNITELMNRT